MYHIKKCQVEKLNLYGIFQESIFKKKNYDQFGKMI